MEYEGLNMVCFDCEHHGHHTDGCPLKEVATKGVEEDNVVFPSATSPALVAKIEALEGNYVGVLKSPNLLVNIRDNCLKEGICECLVRPLGGNMALITAIGKTNLETVVDEDVFPILAIEEGLAFEDRTGAYWQDNDGSFDMSFPHAAFISVMPESVGTANVNDKPSQQATSLATIADSPIPFLGTNFDIAATSVDPRNNNDEMVSKSAQGAGS
ncbi:hypothetical protein Ancab_033613 [Ancistrocladus abbreviatus]